MSSEKMREDFEEWECNANEGPLTDPIWLMRDACSPENYGIVQVQHNWEVWQASRAALAVELPSARNSSCAFFADECYDPDELLAAFASQGIKVKQ